MFAEYNYVINTVWKWYAGFLRRFNTRYVNPITTGGVQNERTQHQKTGYELS